MKILFLIPSKDGGEGYVKLFDSLKSNIARAYIENYRFDYEVNLLINGDSTKPLSYINSNDEIKTFFKIRHVDVLGKIASINLLLEKENADIVAIVDDDVYFSDNLLSIALHDLYNSPELRLVSFQTRAIEYPGTNFIYRFFYDVINIRSLKKLYAGIDPFLFGRLIIARKDAINVPDSVINEDLYLSIIHHGHYVIKPELVYYTGEYSIFRHIRRVVRLETGRKQAQDMLGQLYHDVINKSTRRINYVAVSNLSPYYKMCYYLYCLLRFFTNKIIANFFKHKTSYW